MPFVSRNADFVTVFTGANDVNTITAALGNGAGGSDPAAYIDQKVATFAADYATLINGIRGRATQARIIVLNLPNLAGAALSRHRIAGAEAGGAACVGSDDDDRHQYTAGCHGHRSHVRCAPVPVVVSTRRTASIRTTPATPPRRRSRKGADKFVVCRRHAAVVRR